MYGRTHQGTETFIKQNMRIHMRVHTAKYWCRVLAGVRAAYRTVAMTFAILVPSEEMVMAPANHH